MFGLSDGGAHCGVLCDASVPTYMLAYMTRDRPRARAALECVVHKMTQDTALVYGMADRGVIAPGYRADLNLIDYDALGLEDPRWSTTSRPAGSGSSSAGPEGTMAAQVTSRGRRARRLLTASSTARS